MGSSKEFLKTTALGGFLVLLPLLLLYLVLGEILQAVIALATPIADLLVPSGLLETINFPAVLAVLLILLASFVLGLLARARLTKRLGRAFEERILGALPLYRVLKNLATQITNVDTGSSFLPALIGTEAQGQSLAFLIEDHGDGRATVLLPLAPTPMVGTLRIVLRDEVRLINVPLGDFTRVISHWGVGTRELLTHGK
jgi:uncharacterized membrane protein